eukprot:scaffold275461_cov63-Attheya_sp.AAC.1
MVDANSPLNDAGFAKFVANSTLCDLLGSKHGMDSPPTYLRGSKTIDYLLGTPDIALATLACGMLKFHDGIFTDHRGMYIDLSVFALFRGEIHAIRKPSNRK